MVQKDKDKKLMTPAELEEKRKKVALAAAALANIGAIAAPKKKVAAPSAEEEVKQEANETGEAAGRVSPTAQIEPLDDVVMKIDIFGEDALEKSEVICKEELILEEEAAAEEAGAARATRAEKTRAVLANGAVLKTGKVTLAEWDLLVEASS